MLYGIVLIFSAEIMRIYYIPMIEQFQKLLFNYFLNKLMLTKHLATEITPNTLTIFYFIFKFYYQ